MEDGMFEELKRKAGERRKGGDYAGALIAYRDLWAEPRSRADKWIGWGYAQCLNKQKNYADSLILCRQVYQLDKEFAFNNNLYGWNIYYEIIKPDKVLSETAFQKAIESVIQLTRQETFSPYARTVVKAMEYYIQRKQFEESLKWAKKLDGMILNSQGRSFADAKGIERTLASEQENYYRLYSKALFKAKCYEECIAVVELALKTIPVFHTNTDIWLKRNMALAYAHEGKNEKALTLLKEIMLVKKAWYFHSDAAGIFLYMGEKKKALYHAVVAALGAKEKFSLNLAERLAMLFTEEGKPELARLQIAFYLALKKKNKQKFDEHVREAAQKYQVDVEQIEEYQVLKDNIEKMWQNTKDRMRKLHQGCIEKIIVEKNTGFIKMDTGEVVCFRLKNGKENRNIHQGSNVNFYLERSFDAKRNKEVLVAVDIAAVDSVPKEKQI